MKLEVALIWSLIFINVTWTKSPSMNNERPNKSRWSLINKEDNALTDGSGLNGEDEDDGYGDYEGSSEGSGVSELPNKKTTDHEKSSCLRLLETASFHRMDGAFVPRCTFDGAFEPLQCHGVTGECWCSDRDGRKIPGTVRKEPEMPKCDAAARGATEESRKARVNIKVHPRTTKAQKVFFEMQTNPERRVTATSPKGSIVVDNIAVNEKSSNEVLVPYKTLNGGIGSENKKYSRKNKDSGASATFGGQPGDDGHGKNHVSPSRAALMITHPGVLAGIVCAGVVLVLCFVTFVTFVAYRIRRRSYYEAEEKSKTPPAVGGYVAGSGYGEIYGDGFRYSSAKYQTPVKVPPWTGVDANGSLGYSMRHDRELYG